MMGMRARDSTTWEAMRPPSGSRAPLSARSCIVKRRILPAPRRHGTRCTRKKHLQPHPARAAAASTPALSSCDHHNPPGPYAPPQRRRLRLRRGARRRIEPKGGGLRRRSCEGRAGAEMQGGGLGPGAHPAWGRGARPSAARRGGRDAEQAAWGKGARGREAEQAPRRAMKRYGHEKQQLRQRGGAGAASRTCTRVSASMRCERRAAPSICARL